MGGFFTLVTQSLEAPIKECITTSGVDPAVKEIVFHVSRTMLEEPSRLGSKVLLEKENLSLTKKVLDLKSELCKAIEEKSKFEAQTKTLSTNITSLYKTAIAEIKRKDRTINELWKK
ncbi:hypothetical protein AAG570_009111 [Ranatra chinensis]|uniref:Uncharacterized protein n=1 Tax=Ranatra chinensis TaxID=642074 RepID=A0ABD0YSV8_9HEMI